jgi:hypothetical protein
MQNMETQTQENAVAVRENQRAPVPIGSRGVQINDLEGLWRFSGYVAKSQLAPKGFSNPESIFVAIQMGFEVGLTPMAALQNIAVINGRPSLWGDAQLAVVRGSSLMEFYAEEETNDDLHVLFVELCIENETERREELVKQFARAQAKINRKNDDWGFSVATRRKGEQLRFGRFTVSDAKTAGLWAKEGPWRQYPARMLKFRSRSFLLRDVYGDALKGILSAEEAGDLSGFENAKIVNGIAQPVPTLEPKALNPVPEKVAETTTDFRIALAGALEQRNITPAQFLGYLKGKTAVHRLATVEDFMGRLKPAQCKAYFERIDSIAAELATELMPKLEPIAVAQLLERDGIPMAQFTAYAKEMGLSEPLTEIEAQSLISNWERVKVQVQMFGKS